MTDTPDQPLSVFPTMGDTVTIHLGAYTTNALGLRALDWYARQTGTDLTGPGLIGATIEAAVSQLVATAVTAFIQPAQRPTPQRVHFAREVRPGDSVSLDPGDQPRTVTQIDPAIPSGAGFRFTFHHGPNAFVPADHPVIIHNR